MKIFGLEHILYMVIALVIMTIVIVLIKKFVPKEKVHIAIKIFAAMGLVLIIINRIVVSKSRDGNFLDFLPDTFCSLMGFILPLTILLFKPSTKIFQYAIFAGAIGGLITFVYPDFIVYFDNFFNIHPLTGLLYHTNMFFLFLLCVISKYYIPCFKNWTALPIGLAFMVVYAVFGNSVLEQSNNMYLNAPLLQGTPLTWWLVGILMIVLYTIILQIYEMFTLPGKEWFVVKIFKMKSEKIKEKKQ